MKKKLCITLSVLSITMMHGKKTSYDFQNSEKINGNAKEFTTTLLSNAQEIGSITYAVLRANSCGCPKKNSDIPGECSSKCPCRNNQGKCVCGMPKGKVIALNVKKQNKSSEKLLMNHAQEVMLSHGCCKETISLH